MSSFPSSIPSYNGFTSTHTLQQDTHAAQHNAEQADIGALATKVGTGASTPTDGFVLVGNGNGTSTWGQVPLTQGVSGLLPTANGGTGTAATTGTGSNVFSSAPTISGANLTNSPTLSQPVISDFSNADHNHQNTAGGGQLNAANALEPGSIVGSLISSYSTNRDNNGTNVTETIASLQTGWVCGQPGVAANINFNVTFPIVFTNVPIVIAVMGGDTAGVTSTLGAGGANVNNAIAEAISISTTGFVLRVYTPNGGNWAANNTVYAQWMAIGT
jgi:hypothetical protein